MSIKPHPDASYIPEMQIARGIGILLVTLGHSEPIAQAFPLLWNIIYSFHMPLFFFMSGFFSLRLINRPWLKEIVPRTMLLYVPYLVISLSYGLLKLAIPTVKRPVIPNELFADILFYPLNNPALFLWFIYILLLMKILSPLFRGRGALLLLPLFFLSACWYGSIDLLGISWLLKYLLYYTCGILLGGHHTMLFSILRNIRVSAGVVLLFAVLFIVKGDGDGPLPVLTALTGIWMVLGLSFMGIPWGIGRWLEYCGKLSLEIYLLQYYFIFPVLFTLSHFGMQAGLIVVFTFSAGLLGPIAFNNLILTKNSLLCLLFTGRTEKRPLQNQEKGG